MGGVARTPKAVASTWLRLRTVDAVGDDDDALASRGGRAVDAVGDDGDALRRGGRVPLGGRRGLLSETSPRQASRPPSEAPSSPLSISPPPLSSSSSSRRSTTTSSRPFLSAVTSLLTPTSACPIGGAAASARRCDPRLLLQPPALSAPPEWSWGSCTTERLRWRGWSPLTSAPPPCCIMDGTVVAQRRRSARHSARRRSPSCGCSDPRPTSC